jgi:hypothetical protein
MKCTCRNPCNINDDDSFLAEALFAPTREKLGQSLPLAAKVAPLDWVNQLVKFKS